MKITNRHCMYLNQQKSKIPFLPVVDLNSSLKEPYNQKYRCETNVHIGQRKLLLSEIQLLMEYYKTSSIPPTIVYIGAAPGIHLLYLSKMFPDVSFILYDGATIYEKLKKSKTFEIHEGKNGFFTTKKCIKLKERLLTEKKDVPILFISDIRLGSIKEKNFENNVLNDLKLQKTWVEILQPYMSLLKFRIPFNIKKIKYFKGKLFYGIWSPAKSTETRLLVKQTDISNMIYYDNYNYESILFYHNKYVRPFCFPINKKYEKYILKPNNTHCSCYDCISELNILYEYSKKFKKSFNSTVLNFVKNMDKSNSLNFIKGNNKHKINQEFQNLFL